jgi:hypothetical protein
VILGQAIVSNGGASTPPPMNTTTSWSARPPPPVRDDTFQYNQRQPQQQQQSQESNSEISSSGHATSTVEIRKSRPRLDENDNDEDSFLHRLQNIIPRLQSSWIYRRTSTGDFATLDAWNNVAMNSPSKDRRNLFGWFAKAKTHPILDGKKSFTEEESKQSLLPEPVEDLMTRFGNADSSTLLNVYEEELCKVIGQRKAFWDLIFLISVVSGIREFATISVQLRVPTSIVEALTTTITEIQSILATSTETWIPILFAGAFLATKSKYLLCERYERALIQSVQSSVREDSQYGSLFFASGIVNSCGKLFTREDGYGDTGSNIIQS